MAIDRDDPLVEGSGICRALLFDVVLLDVQTPEMDGLEAARRIRGTWGAAPYVIPLMPLEAVRLVVDG